MEDVDRVVTVRHWNYHAVTAPRLMNHHDQVVVDRVPEEDDLERAFCARV